MLVLAKLPQEVPKVLGVPQTWAVLSPLEGAWSEVLLGFLLLTVVVVGFQLLTVAVVGFQLLTVVVVVERFGLVTSMEVYLEV